MMKQFTCSVIIFIHLFIIYSATPVPSVANDNPEIQSRYYQGDILENPATRGRGVAIRPITSHRWPNGVVPYEFASNISVNHTLLIVQMMREMENLTAVNGVQCISFRPKNSSDTLFITIHNGSGCSAPVGTWPGWTGVRPVSFMHSPTSTCMITGTIQHELTHVLGFYHEQSRPDRDTYVSINWGNIRSSSAFNFDKYNDSEVDTLATPYDYGSVMHYGATAFAINSSVPTITAIFNSSAALGQRIRLSPIDILEIQRGYGCVATPTTTTSTTTTSPLAANATTGTTTTTTSTLTTTTTTTSRTTTSTSTTATTTTTSRTTTSTSTTATTSRTTTSSTTSTTSVTTSLTSVTTVSTTTATTTSVTTATTTSVTTVTTTSVTTVSTTSATTVTTTTVTTVTTIASGFTRHDSSLFYVTLMTIIAIYFQ